MRVAFTGSREFGKRPDERAVAKQVAARLFDKRDRFGWPMVTVSVGDARGADAMVAALARSHGLRDGSSLMVENCDWPPEGSTRQERWMAAHERNGRVLTVRDHLGQRQPADLLVAFFAHGKPSPGTTDCIKQARALGIPVYIWHEGSWSGRREP